jgi:REP element-mobilizing transposase RayT
MARPVRVEFEEAAYHITARGNERKLIFRDDTDRRRFLQTLGEACERFGLVVHAYCLMPNHYHLLAGTPRANLSRAIGWLQATYCIRFNRRHGRGGHLVQGRFKAHLIDADAYAKRLVRYVHLNPVRPRDRRKPVPSDRRQFFEKYPWSSHRAYASSGPGTPDWLCTEWLSYWSDGRGDTSRARRAYAADVAACFGQPLASPLNDLKAGLVLGDESLWKKVHKLLSGRPGKEELRWLKRDNDTQVRQRVHKLIAKEPDRRVRIWARARLAGEPMAALARELGYADGSAVHRVAQRLEAAAQTDYNIKNTLERLQKAVMSGVKS